MRLWPIGLAVVLNGFAFAGCLVLLRLAPSRPAAWVALAGCLFFGCAAGAFAAMMVLQRRRAREPRR